MLQVVEIFDSIRGEGIYIGMPTTFIRLAGCNLRCAWCDEKRQSILQQLDALKNHLKRPG